MNCIECGKLIRHSHYSNMGLCGKKCFNKWRWSNLLDADAIIIGGKCYHVKQVPLLYDLNVKHYKIQMLDTGKVIETNSLWYEGKIPKNYEKQDNAVFLYKG